MAGLISKQITLEIIMRSERSNKTPEEKKTSMISTIIKKLVKYNAVVISDLPHWLDMLDKGHDVNISGMGDSYVQHKLYKLFKLFGLTHDSANKFVFHNTNINHSNHCGGSLRGYLATVLEKSKNKGKRNEVKLKKKCVENVSNSLPPVFSFPQQELNNESDPWILLDTEKYEQKLSWEESVSADPSKVFEEHMTRMMKKYKEKLKQEYTENKVKVTGLF
eukprot:TRINITY_DN1175_c0_g1_i2.p5 TRINITY_DN1175_c0_g1~~TRINITY_DN1175_c0_g1_i2.p5  ORF type:complete len:220 (-),score=27.94 TRINITY_DN1175_c0_g1_i2:2699-3358(-)